MGQQLIFPRYPRLVFRRDCVELARNATVRIPDLAHFVIPAGYQWDGHSVPWLFRGLFPQHDGDIYAAMAHDMAYEYNLTLGIDRKVADEVYRVLMNHPDYYSGWLRATVMPWAVRWFGGPTFRDDAK